MKMLFSLVTGILLLGYVTASGRDTLIPVDANADAVTTANRGTDLYKKHDLEGARRMFDTAIRLDPKLYLARYSRGMISFEQHHWEDAIGDFNACLAVSPSFFVAALRRGQANAALGHYDRSLVDFDRVIDLRPLEATRALARGSRAWIRATCPNPAFRNGAQAVTDAKAACNLTSWGEWDYIDTLAAAYAESGDFDSAIKFEQKTISKTRDPSSIKGAQSRLALYQQHHPYRDVPR